jgi:hypothetical protein
VQHIMSSNRKIEHGIMVEVSFNAMSVCAEQSVGTIHLISFLLFFCMHGFVFAGASPAEHYCS